VIRTPAVQHLLDVGPSQFLTRRQKAERYLSWVLLAAVALLTVGYFTVNTIAHQASAASRRANTSIQAQCQFYHDIANASIAATVTPLGLIISADSRIAYAGLGCPNGTLKTPDPRVAKLLPRGVN
jgi:hypothetical protein